MGNLESKLTQFIDKTDAKLRVLEGRINGLESKTRHDILTEAMGRANQPAGSPPKTKDLLVKLGISRLSDPWEDFEQMSLSFSDDLGMENM